MSSLPLPFAPAPTEKRTPRYYQVEAIEAIERSLETNDSVLLVMATGTGKTFTFSEVAKLHRDRGENILCLAHTRELVEQNAKTLESVLGETCWIEQGPLKAPPYAGIVSASFQSITQDRRLNRFGPDRFGLLIADEAHRCLAPTFLKVLNFFQCKRLGVTATPDRGDERAMGKVFDEVAYVYDIMDGIDAGFLVPIEARNVTIEEVDISHVSLSNGDLVQGELDLAMLQGVEGIVQKTLELEPDRTAVFFFPGIQSAETAAERFNALRPDSARFAHGGTPPEERAAIIADFRAGKFQFLCQCQIAIEGFDVPHVDLIGWARPTRSRWLFAQGAGRGTRVLPGTVDHLPGEEHAARRRMLIRMSNKPDMQLLNFVGNAGRHSLITPEEMLGGDYSEEEVEEAKRQKEEQATNGANEEAYDPAEELKKARARLLSLTREATSQVVATVTKFDPFQVLGEIDLGNDRVSQRYGTKPPTEKQVTMLRGRGIDDDTLRTLDKRSASAMIDSLKQRQAAGLASLKQMRVLAEYGIHDNDITFEAAGRGISYIQHAGWGRKGIDPDTLNRALGREQ